MVEISEMQTIIHEKIQIVYDVYNPSDPGEHVRGKRIGNPYILFETKNGHIMVDIWQTEGITTDTRRSLPDWGFYHLSHLIVLGKNGNFEPNLKAFNPDSKRYYRTICKAR